MSVLTPAETGAGIGCPDGTDPALAFASAGDLGRRIAAGAVSSLAVTELFLQRIERWQPQLNAFVAVYAADARQAARNADSRRAAGLASGPLHGVPFVAKDLFDIAGRPTGAGSRALSGQAAAMTATAVSRLLAAGMVLLGKTQTVEFAFGGWGTNSQLGTPWNPWNLAVHHIPGGSSSGTAVAIAAGLAPCGLGTDTGGSVRIPAGLCGLVGLKTTPGVVSRGGVFPLSRTHDTVGPLARGVEDAALLLDVLQGGDHRDPATAAAPRLQPLPGLGRGAAGFRLAVLEEQDLGDLSPGVAAAYRDAIRRYRDLGAGITTLHLPRPLEDYMRRAGEIMSAESYAVLAEIVDDTSLPIDGFIRERVRRGRDIDVRRYLDLLAFRCQAQAEIDAAMDSREALLLPTCPMPAIPVAAVDETTTPLSRLGRFVNLLDFCAIAVPAGLEAGLPVSIQLAARPFQEPLILRLARAYEQAFDWQPGIPTGMV